MYFTYKFLSTFADSNLISASSIRGFLDTWGGGGNSSAGIATRYKLDGPVIESRWGRDFPSIQTGAGFHPAPTQWVPVLSTQLLCNGYQLFPPSSYAMGTSSFPRVARPGRVFDHPPSPPPSSAEVKGSVELYLSSPSGPSWPVLGVFYTFPGHGYLPSGARCGHK